MRRQYKAALCGNGPPNGGSYGWMNSEARRGCIRRAKHAGPCRNRRFEWERGQEELASPRKDLDRLERRRRR